MAAFTLTPANDTPTFNAGVADSVEINAANWQTTDVLSAGVGEAIGVGDSFLLQYFSGQVLTFDATTWANVAGFETITIGDGNFYQLEHSPL
jgi:hypothetical protein